MEQQLDWFSNPQPGHVVQFYPYDSALISPLSDYIGTGLAQGETCIVIATPKHIRDLDEKLRTIGIPVANVRAGGHYITLDAAEVLDSFMINGLPDVALFRNTVEKVIDRATSLGKPVRAYGEIVALLWQKFNHPAVIELEQLWNGLSKYYSFSLYCAYPKIHFDSEAHSVEQNEISNCHGLAVFS
jgi:hypothetical protein